MLRAPVDSPEMAVRMLVFAALLITAGSFFLLGMSYERGGSSSGRGEFEALVDPLSGNSPSEIGRARLPGSSPFAATERNNLPGVPRVPAPRDDAQAKMVAEIKQALQEEMGLLPLQLLRDRQTSFVALYATDNLGDTTYGTAGYLGDGYFITVKHAVVVLEDDDREGRREIVSLKVAHGGGEAAAELVDAGDADAAVHRGDWAIVRTEPLDLPPLSVDVAFAYDFAEPIFRLGNDYSRGIMLSTGHVGQHTSNGLVTCLTDGHPGVSGGGVLDRHGDLVGIPIGRMKADFRFSFILPLRAEMFRKVPQWTHLADAATASVE